MSWGKKRSARFRPAAFGLAKKVLSAAEVSVQRVGPLRTARSVIDEERSNITNMLTPARLAAAVPTAQADLGSMIGPVLPFPPVAFGSVPIDTPPEEAPVPSLLPPFTRLSLLLPPQPAALKASSRNALHGRQIFLMTSDTSG